jgi:hypothetical protein
MATALAASQKPHLDRPTIPPISWAQDGGIITVIMADGRKVRATIQDINALMFQPTSEVAPIVGADGVRPEPALQPSPPARRTRRKK